MYFLSLKIWLCHLEFYAWYSIKYNWNICNHLEVLWINLCVAVFFSKVVSITLWSLSTGTLFFKYKSVLVMYFWLSLGFIIMEVLVVNKKDNFKLFIFMECCCLQGVKWLTNRWATEIFVRNIRGCFFSAFTQYVFALSLAMTLRPS